MAVVRRPQHLRAQCSRTHTCLARPLPCSISSSHTNLRGQESPPGVTSEKMGSERPRDLPRLTEHVSLWTQHLSSGPHGPLPPLQAAAVAADLRGLALWSGCSPSPPGPPAVAGAWWVLSEWVGGWMKPINPLIDSSLPGAFFLRHKLCQPPSRSDGYIKYELIFQLSSCECKMRRACRLERARKDTPVCFPHRPGPEKHTHTPKHTHAATQTHSRPPPQPVPQARTGAPVTVGLSGLSPGLPALPTAAANPLLHSL